METMCKALMEWETIDRDQVLEIMAGKQPSPPKDYSHNLRQDEEGEASEAPATDTIQPAEAEPEPMPIEAQENSQDKA